MPLHLRATDHRDTKLKEMFSRLAGTEQILQPWDLQDMLTSALSTGILVMLMANSFYHNDFIDLSPVFSLDECRALVSMLDVSALLLTMLRI